MKVIKSILNKVAYVLVHLVVFVICIPSKFGVGKNVCNEFRASADLGASIGAYSRHEYEKCYRILKPYLKLENDYVYGGIKYQLGVLYYNGKGVTLNIQKANSLFEESAKLGWEDAKRFLSDLEIAEFV